MSEAASTGLLPEFAGFFERAAAGHLAFPLCRACGKFHWYPMPRCPHCRGRDIEWRDIRGRGALVSFTRVMHPFDKSRAGRLPYVVALVQFAEAPDVRFVTNIVDGETMDLSIGQPVEPVFATDENGKARVDFKVLSSREDGTWPS